MLRFRPDRLYVGIEARRLTLVRLGGWLSSTVVAAEAFSLPDGESDAIGLPILERELRSPRWRGTRVEVILADSLVRYFIAPVPAGARNGRELGEAAVLRFEEILGDEARAWTVTVDPTPLASHQLGCAVRTSWLNDLRRICREVGLPLACVMPFGVAEYNRNERRIGVRSGWFAALGIDSLWLAFKSGNGWQSAQLHHCGGDPLVQLPQLLARDQLRAAIETPSGSTLWLTGVRPDGLILPALSNTTTQCLGVPVWPGQDDAWSRTFRLPLSSVWPRCA